MKRVISLIVVLLTVVFSVVGCAQDSQQQSIEPTETATSSTEQQESEEQSNDEYEDELFAEAAQFLNNKDYVSAHEVAEKSASGKCKDAVEYAIADAFSREMLYGANVITEILNTVTAESNVMNDTMLKAVANVPVLAKERVEPLYRITSEIPKDILPREVHTNYDSYLQLLDLGKQILSTLPDCWNDSGEQTEYMTEWNAISATYSEMLTPTLDTTQYLNEGYTLPAEYRELLDTNVFFNYGSCTSALKIDDDSSQAMEGDFRNAVWGMSQDEVKQSETVELIDVNGVLGSGEFSNWEDDIVQRELDGSTDVYLYGAVTDNEGAENIISHVFYGFNTNGQLSNAMVYMGKDIGSYADAEEQKAIATQLYNTFTEKYGEPLTSGGTYIGVWEMDRSIIALNCPNNEERGWEGILLQFISQTIDIPPSVEDSDVQEDKSTNKSTTVSQSNAVNRAKSYLDYTAFSRQGLIEQLEYEGFSNADATYGADHSGADWMEQAAKKAESYLEYSSFSRSGLIDQLEYEGFTHEQAVHGVNSVGL